MKPGGGGVDSVCASGSPRRVATIPPRRLASSSLLGSRYASAALSMGRRAGRRIHSRTGSTTSFTQWTSSKRKSRIRVAVSSEMRNS
eukprot:5854080-Pleurochrysis_carterae.AAC.1